MLTIKIKCPCETNDRACCACVSMHCDECHDHSKFKRGRFCSNCGRPLEAELQRNYIPRADLNKAIENFIAAQDKVMSEAKAELAKEIFEEIEKILAYNYLGYARCYQEAVASEIATLKEKYIN